jgi:hypothetical protein
MDLWHSDASRELKQAITRINFSYSAGRLTQKQTKQGVADREAVKRSQ